MADEPPGPQAPDAAGPGAARYLTFRVGDDMWALPVGEVREVVRPLATTRVPQGPPCLEGLGNLRGTVLPVASVRALLRLEPRDRDAATRIIVVDHEAPVGLTVDSLGVLLDVEAGQVREVDVAADLKDGAADGAIMAGHDGGEVRLLPARRLLAAEFSALRPAARRAAAPTAAMPAAPADAAAPRETRVLIGCEAAGQDYALPLDSVREVLALPGRVSTVPRSGSAALGVITLRDQLLPLVSLRALLGLPPASEKEGAIIVVSLGGARVGLVADRMGAIIRLDPSRIDPVPAVLNRAGGEAEIEAIGRLEDGGVIALLSPRRLFGADAGQRAAMAADPERSETLGETDGAGAGIEQFVSFRIDGDEFGLPIAAVDEVMRVPAELARLPRAPDFIEGIVNLRGAAVPVIDQRRRFDLPAMARNAGQRIVVLRIGGTRVGLIVDMVTGILKVAPDRILPAPELTAEQFRLISRVAWPEEGGRMVLLIDPVELVDQTEARLLAGVGGAGAPTKTA